MIVGDRYLEYGDERSGTRLCLNTRRHDRLPSVSEHDDITGLEVRRRVLDEAEIIAGCVVEAVDGHRAPSIGRLAALLDPRVVLTMRYCEPRNALYSSATRFGTTNAQASSTSSRISSTSMAARRT